jgi:hypothetical protein
MVVGDPVSLAPGDQTAVGLALRCGGLPSSELLCPPPGGFARLRSRLKIVTWLILPVVICLSQRLSHACLSISNLYGETANGSLNQLSFI